MDETKEKEVEKVERFGDQINFNELFRVKGKKGLFCTASTVHKSGMIRMSGFLDYKSTVVVNQDKLICLGHILYSTELGVEAVNLNDVFSNLFEFYEKSPEDVPGLAVFVPNYDPNEFKERHAFQILGWFNEFLTKMEEINGYKETTKSED